MRISQDLNWLLTSPDLLNSEFNLRQSLMDLLTQEPLKNTDVIQAVPRLGHYFENLWCYLLENSKGFDLLAKNLQAIIDIAGVKQTIGEFDSVFFDKIHNKTIHTELAVKFYLQVGTGEKLSDWVGPNLSDRFDHKYQRLLQHQLKLSDFSEIQDWLQQQKLKIDQVKLLSRGRLFYPWHEFQRKQWVFPNEANPRHDKGFWLSSEDFKDLLSEQNYQWYQLPKMFWLAQVQAQDLMELEPITHENLSNRLQKVVAIEQGKEVMRGFVVSEEWLQAATLRVNDD